VPQFMKTRIARIIAVVALLVALYALAGFVIAPKLARSALLEDIPKTLLGVTPSVGDIRINPFLLQVEVKDFSLAGRGGEKLVGFERLFLNFELSSLWHRAYSFGRIEINALYANAQVAKNGTLNLLELRPKPPERVQTRAEKGTLPAVHIGSFKVTRGTVSYEDRSRTTEFADRLEPIEFELTDFSTGVEGGLFNFSGSSKLGEKLEWHGHLSVQPIESDGELRIEGLRAHTIWEYLEDRLNFVVNSGRIDVDAAYRFALKEAVDLQLTISKVAVTDFTVRPRNSDLDWISVPVSTLSAASVDLSKRRAQVDSLSLSGVKVAAWREPDGSINLLALAAAPAVPAATPGPVATPAPAATRAPAPAPATATAVPAGTAAASAPWQFELGRFELRDASIAAEDRTTNPAAKVLLSPMSVEVRGVSLDLSKPVHLVLDTHINQTGSIAASGDVTPQPLAASLSLKLAGVDLTALQPYVAQYSSMTLRGGQLASEAQLHYAGAQQRPTLQFSGNVHVANLHTIDNVRQDDFVDWERLDILGVTYQQAPDRLDIAGITARKPYARVTIEPDTSLSVKRVLTAPGSAPRPAPGSAQAPGARSASSSGSAPGRARPAGSRAASADVARAAGGAVRGTASPAPAASMPMTIKKIVVQQGTANFTDLSIAPTFSAGIQHLDGTVLGLSSQPNSRAKVDLHGDVDAYSPVSIKGELNLLSAALYTDISMNFRNIELTIFNPYSGKFAGYNISKGKLTTELHYKVEDRKLDAQHHIVIDQLEFGDKTASKDAVSLPVKLAVALLKDRNGVIDLDVPVGGSLDDPKFRLWPIIWKVFVNILEKAVTAPFALLGRLFGGGPDLEYIDFQPGAVAADAAGGDKIITVAKALQERPQLKIDVPIGYVSDIDRPALVAAKFNAELSDAQAARGTKKTAAAAPRPWEQLDPATQLELLTTLYARDVGAAPTYPDTIAAIKQKPDAIAAKIEFLTAQIRAHVVVGDTDLRSLGEQRAMSIQQALLTNTQIDPSRVFLVANDKATAKDGVVRLQLSLK